MSVYQAEVCASIHEIEAQEWNGLAAEAYPFCRHEFLAALEDSGSIGAQHGWLPRYLLARSQDGDLVAAVPMYEKHNSYGEFVFDWAWADAYQRSGLNYYPKLVIGIPYTPAPGPRILCQPQQQAARSFLMRAAQSYAQQCRLSSVHWLFTDESTTDELLQNRYLHRSACQFHWQNHHYRNFDDFLSHLTAAKRKKIKRERRRVQEAGIQLQRLSGDQVSDEQWQIWHQLYASTFDKRGGEASLSVDFFRRLAAHMPQQVLLVFATLNDRIVAAAFNIVGSDTLYGRHWGCLKDYHSLHFEACYYQGLEYCIQQGLQHFQPGAQGEHKLARGFLPVLTRSAHWLREDHLQDPIRRFLLMEEEAVSDYMNEMTAHSPYRQDH
ncbi:MAG: GNAT family N-acetyltransferase [gamma proteobacterium symbiont of Bathyaustriella thionipta]|nr:GNAT family N-acetyltransferase [gamma proteobacterium symbiont of Bathyaustriella thionipta]